VKGFTAPLTGLNELALLVGNLAHESGAFQYTEEIRCAGVTQVTGDCPYGLYHGRGYIQISWLYNYQAAANYLNNQNIVNNPDVVKNDPTVNWQTVQWFWTANVQPMLRKRGYTLGASVRAINGGLECDSGPIAAERVRYIQCFQQNFGVAVDSNTQCPAAAIGDNTNTYNQDPAQISMSGYGIALVVLGALSLVILAVVLALVFTASRTKTEERA